MKLHFYRLQRKISETEQRRGDEFWSVIDKISSEIAVYDLQMLKVALYDIIKNKNELDAASANTLFRLLHSEGYIEIGHVVNCDLLFEVFDVTGLQILLKMLSKKYHRRNQANKITGYRRMLVKLGRSLNSQQVDILAKLFNIERNPKNAWDLIKRLTQEKIENTIASLKNVEALVKGKQELSHVLTIVRSFVQLKKLNDVPLEVLARGKEANDAFLNAIQEGSKPIYQTRLMLVGQERVGKTSLTKALTDQPFNATEKVTNGIEASLSCTISVKHTNNWKPNENKATGEARKEYIRTLAERMAHDIWRKQHEKLKEDGQENKEVGSVARPEEENLLPYTNEGNEGRELNERPDVENVPIKRFGRKKREYEEKFGKKILFEGTAEIQPKACLTSDIQEEVFELVEHILGEKKKDGETDVLIESKELQEAIDDLTLSIWDFAGQDLYYITHQMFLVSRAIYIICFNLCHDLNAPSRVKFFHRDYGKISDTDHYMTNLDRVVFWAQSIYSHTSTTKNSTLKQYSPPIFIVGTHREILPGNDEKKEALTEEKFSLIREAFKGKPYEHHIVCKYYALDNSVLSEFDILSIFKLRRHITEVAKNEPYMGERMPISWLNFMGEIEQLRDQHKHSINFKQVTKLAFKCHIDKDDQLFVMLHFYHDLGNIVYYGERDTPNSPLNDIIILIPQWLIYIFKLVITVKDPSEQYAEFRSSWKKLDEEGLLEERLLRRMWHDCLKQFEALIQLMQKFDLLCVKTQSSQTKCTKVDRLFYVPSLLKKNQGDEMASLDKLTKSKTASVLYVDFNGFLPEGLYYRLVVRIVHWSQQRSLNKGYNPRLFYQQVKVYIDQNHDAIIRILPERRSCIQVIIYRLKVDEDEEPSPSVCKDILKLIEENLLDINHKWSKRVVFNFCVLCSVCPMKNIHLHKLNDCLESTPRCGTAAGMNTSKIRRLFGKVEANPGCPVTATQVIPKVPGFLRFLIGVYKDIPSPILPFEVMTEVCVLLDPPHPRANDWRRVACKIGYDRYINYLMDMMRSPTMCVMQGWSEQGLSLDDFKTGMIEINRHDVVSLIEEHLTKTKNYPV
ncbi:uncharacterized protein [Antedon mediterranea]|uniref:uncharacterized protein n=1 Tax=Antedon mediterranea TaxID=105859 RepID=UPI003AF94191